MHRGYVKLWRKVLDAGWFKQHKLYVFWSWCLVKASHKEIDIMVGSQTVHLMPGDFVFGLYAASNELDLTIQEIRTVIDRLRKRQNLTIKTTNKYSIISIVNWNIYQSEEDTNNKQINKQVTSSQQATNNKQECKELKNEKKETYSVDFETFWKAYPKKKGKDAAWTAWKKRNGSRPALDILLKAISWQKDSNDWQKDNGDYIPHPSTWINQGRWNDESTKVETYMERIIREGEEKKRGAV